MSKTLNCVCLQLSQAILQDQFVNAVTVNGGDEEVWLTAKQWGRRRVASYINKTEHTHTHTHITCNIYIYTYYEYIYIYTHVYLHIYVYIYTYYKYIYIYSDLETVFSIFMWLPRLEAQLCGEGITVRGQRKPKPMGKEHPLYVSIITYIILFIYIYL